MGDMITKPDANPILLAILNIFPCGLLPIGYFMIGQTKKAIGFLVATWLLSCIGGIGFLLPWIAAYDAYLLGQRLAAGESITPNTNGLSFLDAIFKD